MTERASRAGDLLLRPVVSYANGREIVIAFGRWGINPDRVTHGPFEKIGLICLCIPGTGTECTIMPAVRPWPDNQCALVGVIRVTTTGGDYRQSPTINHSCCMNSPTVGADRTLAAFRPTVTEPDGSSASSSTAHGIRPSKEFSHE